MNNLMVEQKYDNGLVQTIQQHLNIAPIPAFHTKVVEALGGPKIDVPMGRKDVTMEDAENRLPDGSWSEASFIQTYVA